MVVISDGEDPAPDLPPLAALLQRNIRVFALGIGTSEGIPVPVYDQKGQHQQMLVDANATQVTSRLDEGRLRSLAEQSGGRSLRYEGSASAREIADAIRAIDAGLVPAEAGVSPENRYQIFLGIAVVALLAGWLIDERRPMPRPRSPRIRPAVRRRWFALIGAGLFALGACGPTDPLAGQLDAANDVFKRDPAAALARYRELAIARPTSRASPGSAPRRQARPPPPASSLGLRARAGPARRAQARRPEPPGRRPALRRSRCRAP